MRASQPVNKFLVFVKLKKEGFLYHVQEHVLMYFSNQQAEVNLQYCNLSFLVYSSFFFLLSPIPVSTALISPKAIFKYPLMAEYWGWVPHPSRPAWDVSQPSEAVLCLENPASRLAPRFDLKLWKQLL